MQNMFTQSGILCLRKQMLLPFKVCERCMYFVRFDHDKEGRISSALCEWNKDTPIPKKTELSISSMPPVLTDGIPGIPRNELLDKQDNELIHDTKDGEIDET